MIVINCQPLSVIDDQGFQSLVKALESKYSLPSRYYITDDILPHTIGLAISIGQIFVCKNQLSAYRLVSLSVQLQSVVMLFWCGHVNCDVVTSVLMSVVMWSCQLWCRSCFHLWCRSWCCHVDCGVLILVMMSIVMSAVMLIVMSAKMLLVMLSCQLWCRHVSCYVMTWIVMSVVMLSCQLWCCDIGHDDSCGLSCDVVSIVLSCCRS